MSKLLSLIIQSRSDSSDVYAYHSYGSLPNYIAQKINQITGVDCRSSEILITAYDIAHIFKGYSNDILERERGQIGVTPEDFELIKTIIYEFESVQKGKILRNTTSLVFTKKIKCSYYLIVKIEGKFPNKKMIVKTMFKKS